MPIHIRELRYVRIATSDVAAASRFATAILGLQAAGATEGRAFFRSDFRAYSLCFSELDGADAIGLTVASPDDLDAAEAALAEAGIESSRGTAEQCTARQVKAFVACRAPNGLVIELVLRPLTSGWRYFGARDAGITGLLGVSLRSRDAARDEAFWTGVLGAPVSDWAGDAAYLRLDEAHHRIALHPSTSDGLMGVGFEVEGIDQLMQNFYALQAAQLPIVHGPGRQPTSGQTFVVTRGPEDKLFMYGSGMDRGEAANRPPRQFPHAPRSFCAWGSDTRVPEFGADTTG